MQVRKWAVAVIALLGLALTVALGSTAHATITSQICGNGGTGYCLNDRGNGGSNSVVQMWYGGVTNDNFDNYQLISMCNHGYVSATMSCPFTPGSGLNTFYNGDPIIAVHYLNQGANYCVDASNAGYAYLGSCPDLSGNGGSQGTIMVGYPLTGCNGTGQSYYVDRYLTDQALDSFYLDSGGGVGVQAFYSTLGGSTATCWGQVAG